MTNHRSELELGTLPKLQHKAFLGIVEDERGRVVTTENDRYIQGQYCRLGKDSWEYSRTQNERLK